MEILVTVAIIGILGAVIVPSVSSAVEKSRTVRCTSNLKQFAAAFQMYIAENNGLMPAAGHKDNPLDENLSNPKNSNWFVEISDYTDSNAANSARLYRKFECPTFRNKCVGKSGYVDSWLGYGMNLRLFNAANDSTSTAFIRQKINKLPAPSRTVLIGESTGYNLDIHPNYQFTPVASELEGWKKGGTPDRHGETSNYLFLDGHIEALKEEAAVAVLKTRINP